MSFFEEFKKFAMRGNVIDLAVGVVIGGMIGSTFRSAMSGFFRTIHQPERTALRYFKGCSGCTCPYFSLRSFYKYYR